MRCVEPIHRVFALAAGPGLGASSSADTDRLPRSLINHPLRSLIQKRAVLKDQQALPGAATLSLVQFNHEVRFQHEFAPLAEVEALGPVVAAVVRAAAILLIRGNPWVVKTLAIQ